MGGRKDSSKLLAAALALAAIPPVLAAALLWLAASDSFHLTRPQMAGGGAVCFLSLALTAWAVASLRGLVTGTQRVAGRAAQACPEAAEGSMDEIELVAEAIERLSQRSAAKAREVALLEARLAEASASLREVSCALDGVRVAITAAVHAVTSRHPADLAEAVRAAMGADAVVVVPRRGEPFGSTGIDAATAARTRRLLVDPEVDGGAKLATPLIVNALPQAPPWAASALGALGAARGLVAPLRGPSGVLGVMFCAYKGEGSLCRSDADLSAALGGLVALALEGIDLSSKVESGPQVDADTGLPGRAEFGRKLREELARVGGVSSCCVALLELGGEEGAQVAPTFARMLREACSPVDFPFRLGAETFAVVMGSRSLGDGRAFCERLVRNWKDMGRVTGRDLSLACGLAFCPGDGRTVDELMSVARVGVTSAKARGGGTWHFGEEAS